MKYFFKKPDLLSIILVWAMLSLIVLMFAVMISNIGDETIFDNQGVVETTLKTQKSKEGLTGLRWFFWSYYTEPKETDYTSDRFGDRASLVSDGTMATWFIAGLFFFLAYITSPASLRGPESKIKRVLFWFFASIPFVLTLFKLEFLLWVSGVY